MTNITEEMMINYLKSMMDSFKKDEAEFGMDRGTTAKLDAMIACKEMVEALIQKPVNLKTTGEVTVGF